MTGELALGRAAAGLGARVAARGALAALGPVGWAAIAALTLYDGYQLYNMMKKSEEGEGSLSDKPATDCVGDCAEAKAKEDEKIEEMDDDSVQKPGDKEFNRDRPGDLADANKDFDDLVGEKWKDQGNGIRTGTLSDGRKVTIRPNSKSNGPTLDIQTPAGRPIRKYRYPNSPTS